VEEKMRRVISMPVAIIAALVVLAGFDSAARSDEQALPHPVLQPDGMLLE
jgi:hypothetical protein